MVGLLLVCLVWAGGSSVIAGSFSGGTGQVGDPYHITTAEQLISIKSDPNLLNKHFILMADIDLNPDLPGGRVFDEALIGHTEACTFRGWFDGNGHVIRNMHIQAPDTGAVGVFGRIEDATIMNIGVEDCHVQAKGAVGGLVGQSHGSTVMLSYAKGVVSGESNVGGLMGRSYNDVVSACYAVSSVTGGNHVGGLQGHSHQSTVITSYACCSVTSDGYFVGGLIGGGYEHSAYLSYWDVEISGLSTSFGGKGKSFQSMTSAATYRGWGEEAQWTLNEGRETPRLAWENQSGQPIVDARDIYGGGTGQPHDPYQIWTAQQMLSIGYSRADFQRSFALMTDFDFAEIDPNEIIPIGTLGLPFTGVFYGRGHTISHMRFPVAGLNYVGLFGYINSVNEGSNSPAGEVRDLHLEGIEIGANRFVGGLVGLNKGRIVSCSVSGNVSGEYFVGGLAGLNDSGVITSSYADSHVDGGAYLGGLAGGNSAGNIVSSYATGSVSGGYAVGGLVGSNREGAVITSYATTHVIGDSIAGGLVGNDASGAVYLSYWDTETSGMETSEGGQGRTPAQLQKQETFRGWGNDMQWTLAPGQDTPRLVWEGRPGQVIQDDPQPYDIGTGDPNDPYQIWTAADLTAIGWYHGDWDKCFVVMADIDVNTIDANEVLPIGLRGYPFTGYFDGEGHTVWNFKCQLEQADNIGLFGAVGVDASMVDGPIGEIRNLQLASVEVVGKGYVGGMVGYNEGRIVDCGVQGDVYGSSDFVGGLIGFNSKGDVISSLADCQVYGDDYIGGLVGYNREGRILTSAAWGDVRGDEDAGGLAGSNGGIITQCYATGDVSYGEGVGGLVNYNGGTITECYAAGNVTGDEHRGGLVSGGSKDKVLRSFWDIETSGRSGSDGGIGLTTEAMQTAQTYLDAGWDFAGTWMICEGFAYPRLQWEQRGCAYGTASRQDGIQRSR